METSLPEGLFSRAYTIDSCSVLIDTGISTLYYLIEMNYSFIEQLMVYRSCKTVFQMPLKYWTTLLYPMKSPLPRPQPVITRLMVGVGRQGWRRIFHLCLSLVACLGSHTTVKKWKSIIYLKNNKSISILSYLILR